MRVGVIDTGVVVAGIYWRNEPNKILRAVALGFLRPVLTEPVFEEYVRVAWRLREREQLTPEPIQWLETLQTKAIWVSPSPLGRPCCRDPQDDKFIEAALEARCGFVVARDRDLTVLEKPFGISILTPRGFLAGLSRSERQPPC